MRPRQTVPARAPQTAQRGNHEKTIAQLKTGLAFHTVPTMREPANVADLGDETPGGDTRDPTQRLDDLRHRLQVAGDHPVMAHFAVSPLLGERDVDRFVVDIHPQEHATFRHGLPPLYVALRGTLIGVA